MDIRAFTASMPGKSLRLVCTVDLVCGENKKSVPALWDTGATASAISHDVVSSLKPKLFGQQRVSTPTGTKDVDTYCLDVFLPNSVKFEGLVVTDSEIGSQGIGMLIGMDIIGDGDFAVTNLDGQTVFTYRYPSSKRIDFVKQAAADEVIGKRHGKGSRKKK